MKKSFNTLLLASALTFTLSIPVSAATFSEYWHQNESGNWYVQDLSGNVIKNAWLCDDAIEDNGKDVWYLLDANGNMISSGLVQDQTGNYYSLETNHNGYFGMLRYVSGNYDGITLDLESSHNGSFAEIKNDDAIIALQQKYGLEIFDIDNSNCVYTSTFKEAKKIEPTRDSQEENYLQLYKDIQSGKTSASSIPDADYKLALEAGNKAGLTANSNSTTTSKQSQAENDLPADIAAAAQNMRTQLRAQGCSESEIQSRVNSFIRTRLNSGIGTGRANNDFGYIR